MRLSEIAAVVDGRVVDAPDDALVVAEAAIDSREVQPGGLFAAFVGEHVDGHDYAAAAMAAGAAGLLASRPTGFPSVLVDDPQRALGLLAHHVLGRLDSVQVVAVTGSQGKTTTKDLLAVVLATHGETVATRGSFNNELGLPLTVLRANPSTDFLVLEMGARGVGHLRDLCAIAPPSVSLVLNVGKAHLGEFGDQDTIALAKGELVEALPATGWAVLNADDERVAAMAGRTTADVLTFGRDPGADVVVDQVRVDAAGHPSGRLVHRGVVAPVQLRLVGEHQIHNAAAAAAVALVLGMDLPAVAGALSEVSGLSRWRMEVHERADGVTVVNDAYNANPDSAAAALRALVSLAGDGRRTVAVLGEMRELGASAEQEHAALGRLAVTLGIDVVLVVGQPARAIRDGAQAQLANPSGEDTPMPPSQVVLVDDNAAALAWLGDNLRAGDVALLKASRAAGLDEVAAALLNSTSGESR